MKTTIATLGAVALLALGAASAASAAGSISSATARYYSSHVRYSIAYDVWDNLGVCTIDEYGFYNDPNCESYDTNTADLDVQVWKINKRRGPYRRVYGAEMYGDHGRASESLYAFDVHAPLFAKHGTKLYYKVKFRLFDPVSDSVVSSTVKFFWFAYR